MVTCSNQNKTFPEVKAGNALLLYENVNRDLRFDYFLLVATFCQQLLSHPLED